MMELASTPFDVVRETDQPGGGAGVAGVPVPAGAAVSDVDDAGGSDPETVEVETVGFCAEADPADGFALPFAG